MRRSYKGVLANDLRLRGRNGRHNIQPAKSRCQDRLFTSPASPSLYLPAEHQGGVEARDLSERENRSAEAEEHRAGEAADNERVADDQLQVDAGHDRLEADREQ